MHCILAALDFLPVYRDIYPFSSVIIILIFLLNYLLTFSDGDIWFLRPKGNFRTSSWCFFILVLFVLCVMISVYFFLSFFSLIAFVSSSSKIIF